MVYMMIGIVAVCALVYWIMEIVDKGRKSNA